MRAASVVFAVSEDGGETATADRLVWVHQGLLLRAGAPKFFPLSRARS